MSKETKLPKVVPQYKEEAKERIIQAALEVFAEKGLYKATMDDIAKKLGVSKGALYLYFKSKDELIREITKRPEQDVRRFLATLLQTKNLESSLDEALSKEKDDQSKRRPLVFDFLAEASMNPETRKALTDAYSQNLRTLSNFLAEKGRNSNESRCQAISLMSLYIGVIASSILGVDTADLKQAWRQSTRAIVARQSDRKN